MVTKQKTPRLTERSAARIIHDKNTRERAIQLLRSTLIYIERNGKYLMIHRTRKQNDVNKDKWIGVGGKIESGELPETCARREVLEETGLSIGEIEYRGIVYFESDAAQSEEMHLFKTTDFTGVLTDCDEGELEWIDKHDVFRLPIWEGDKVFLKLLDTNEPFFRLKLIYAGEKLVKTELNGRIM